jgi:hypothetical protein
LSKTIPLSANPWAKTTLGFAGFPEALAYIRVPSEDRKSFEMGAGIVDVGAKPGMVGVNLDGLVYVT